jgi:CO/xanthine dehydrogenase FAD-binding subunit
VKNIKYFSFPGTPKAALSALLDRKSEAMAVAGGTLAAKTLPETVENFVGLKNLPLNYIKKRGADLVIGALATFDEIDNSKLAKSWAGGAVSAAAARCSSQLIRNMATIGGNIARPHSFNIFPVVLLGLDARVRLLAGPGVKTVPFADLYGADLKLKPGRDCLILEIIIPGKTRNWSCRFEKFAKTEASWEAYLTLFMAASAKAGTVKEARVAVGALSPKPFRAQAAEHAVSGEKPGAAVIKAAALELGRELDAARAGDFKKAAAASLFERFMHDFARKLRPGGVKK